MNRKHVYLAFFLLAFTAIVVFIIVWQLQKNPWDGIKDFNSCVKAGYPVKQNYYPPEYSLPNGRFFVQQVVPGR